MSEDRCERHVPSRRSASAYNTDICPHCAADSEILEEKIGLVVAGVDVLIEAKARAARGFADDVDESREAFRHALRELVREVRR